MTAPKVAASPQDIAILNLNMLMQLEGRYRKDLAEYIGRRPQNLSRMMSGESNWALNDMWKAAEFVGVSLDVLTDPTLTPAKALSIIGERKLARLNPDRPVSFRAGQAVSRFGTTLG